MKDNRYFAKDSPDAFERERLALLTELADPITTRRLTDLGVGPGWRCLDVGAGDGSVARWLAGRVGPEGARRGDRPQPPLPRRTRAAQPGSPPAQPPRGRAGNGPLRPCPLSLRVAAPPGPLAGPAADGRCRPARRVAVRRGDRRSAPFGATDPEHPRAAAFDRTTRALSGRHAGHGAHGPHLRRRVPALVERFGIRRLAA